MPTPAWTSMPATPWSTPSNPWRARRGGRARMRTGLSPRAGLALLACARAWALLGDRDYTLPEDVQAVFVAIAGHRLIPARTLARDALAQSLLATVAVE